MVSLIIKQCLSLFIFVIFYVLLYAKPNHIHYGQRRFWEIIAKEIARL